jgi:hypothetical protein
VLYFFEGGEGFLLLDLDDDGNSELVGGSDGGIVGPLAWFVLSIDGLQVREMLSRDFGFVNLDGGMVVGRVVEAVLEAAGPVSMQTGPAIEAQMCPS